MLTLAKLPLAVLILSGLALMGCAPTRVRLAPLPIDLTFCADEPVPPALPAVASPADQVTRDMLTLDYVLALRLAWGDCRAKVDGAKAWNEKVTK